MLAVRVYLHTLLEVVYPTLRLYIFESSMQVAQLNSLQRILSYATVLWNRSV